MYDYEFGSSTGEGPHGSFEGPVHQGGSTMRLIVTIAAVAVLAALGLGLAFWVFGFLFSLAGWVLRVAIVAGVAALIWRRVVRGRCRCGRRRSDHDQTDYSHRHWA